MNDDEIRAAAALLGRRGGLARTRAQRVARRANIRKAAPPPKRPGPHCDRCGRPLTPEGWCRRCDWRKVRAVASGSVVSS